MTKGIDELTTTIVAGLLFAGRRGKLNLCLLVAC